jgi:hypothetical protein
MSARRKKNAKEAELGAAGFQRGAGAEAEAARARRGLPPPAIAAGTAERRGAHREPQQMRVRAQGSAVARPCRQGEDLRAAAVLPSAAGGGRGFVGSLGRRQTEEGGQLPGQEESDGTE